MDRLLERLQRQFPELVYKPGTVFCWSPQTSEVFYDSRALGEAALWSLLHETSHALLHHTAYRTDFELLRLEVAAWEQTRALAQDFGIILDEDHVQDCLDTYRDWLYARSICPRCTNKCLQQPDLRHYRCFNCHASWKVTPSRFCRAYRATAQAEPIPIHLVNTLATT